MNENEGTEEFVEETVTETTTMVEARQPFERVFDVDNPMSVWNKVWFELQDRMKIAYEARPDLFEENERQMLRRFQFDALEQRLRLRFWDEYWTAVDRGRKMKMAEVTRGACSPLYWKQFLKEAKNVAWLLNVPVDVQSSMKLGIYNGIRQMHAVLDEPIRDPQTGKLNLKLAELQLKILTTFDNRVNGGIIQKMAIQQRVESRNTHVLQGGAPGTQIQDVEKTLKAVDRELRQLQGKRDELELEEEFSIRDEIPVILDSLREVSEEGEL